MQINPEGGEREEKGKEGEEGQGKGKRREGKRRKIMINGRKNRRKIRKNW